MTNQPSAQEAIVKMHEGSFTLMPANAGEFILLVLGLGIGVLYSLDGWNVTKSVTALKDSPRVQNLKYALFGAGVAFLADLKQFGITTGKDRLLMFYALGFFITAPTVIIFVAAAISLQFRRLQQTRPGITFPGHHPALHYVFWGFNDYKAKLQEAQAWVDKLDDYRKFIHRFLPEYNKQVSKSIAAVDYYLATSTEPIRKQVAREILVLIQAVVTEYNDRKQGLNINVNYMRAYPFATAPSEVKDRMRFGKKGASYGWLLVLEEYADDDGRESFALPVPSEGDRDATKILLPGAPEAFFHNTTAVITETGQIDFPSGIDPGIKTEIKSYFSTKKTFNSFASVPILHRSTKCGVVNVESNAEYVFGRDEETQKEISNLIKPLCLLLGFVIGA